MFGAAPPTESVQLEWIPTTDLLRRMALSRIQLSRLREADVFKAGTHFISRGAGPKAGYLWHYGSVVNALAVIAEQNESTALKRRS